ncbi:hypothetical protein ACEZ3G_14350 [Maribacter algicola]|uniref:Uncharacterized protein n=1 Tax=Meishania litoralis TaxID=3434685 RepID=A0ACC7LN75_9FLAO
MKKIVFGLIVILFLLSSHAQDNNAKTGDNGASKKTVTFRSLPVAKSLNPNYIGLGNFNPLYPNFYTYWSDKFWPIEVINIQYLPSSNLTVPTNKKGMSIEISGKTQIPGQEFINIGPPVYETSDLAFYEKLFRESKEYILVFNFNGRGHLMYYHKSLCPDYFK